MVTRALEETLEHLDDALVALSGALDVCEYGGVGSERASELAALQVRMTELAEMVEVLLYDY